MNPTGIEAAHAAYAKTVGGLLDGHPMENAIQAYLAATLPADVAGLVERLEADVAAHKITGNGGMRRVADVATAIDTIASLSARAEAAEAALATAREALEQQRAVLRAVSDTAQCVRGLYRVPIEVMDRVDAALQQPAIRSLTGVPKHE